MKRRSLLVLTAALVAVLALAVPALASSSAPSEARAGTTAGTNDPAAIRGYITEKKDRTILVESRPCRRDGEVVKYTRCDPSRWRGDKGYFEVDGRTTIRDRSGEPTTPARYEDLKVGQVVKATYRGPFRPSYPSEGGAKRVSILVQVGRPLGG